MQKRLKSLRTKGYDGLWLHVESTLVLQTNDTSKKKLVIGRWDSKENKYIEFDQQTLDLCVQENMEYDPDLVDSSLFSWDDPNDEEVEESEESETE